METEQAPPVRLLANPQQLSIAVAQEGTLEVTIELGDTGLRLLGASVTAVSKDPTVVTVDPPEALPDGSGVIQLSLVGNQEGTTVITLESGDLKLDVTVTVTEGGCLSVAQAIAANSGDSSVVEDADILFAVQLWVMGGVVPGTCGQTISDAEILRLVELWIGGQPILSARVSGQVAEQDREALIVHQMRAYPNPIGDPNVAHFVAEGQGIQSIEVEVFDLSGGQVFGSGEVHGQSLEWNLQNDNGDLVANGVYLYVVTARGFDEQVKRSEIRKLILMR